VSLDFKNSSQSWDNVPSLDFGSVAIAAESGSRRTMSGRPYLEKRDSSVSSACWMRSSKRERRSLARMRVLLMMMTLGSGSER
jgi:hypothetical protein